MLNRKLISSPLTEYLYSKASASGVPLSGTFELTPLCNMNCKMCYVRLNKETQEKIGPLALADEWITLAQKAKEEGMLYLLLTGGEPFSHPQFQKIMTELHRMGLIISINSNATMIDENVIEWLKEVPPVRVNVTLYGASDETYERLCRHPKGFTQADKGIRLLRQAGIAVRINCSITPHNVQDLPQIVEYARKNNLQIQPAAYMFPPMRKDMSLVGTNDRLMPEEAAYYTAYAEYLIYGKERFLEKSENTPTLTELDDDCREVGDGVRCRAGKCSFWITWDGKMLPCGMFPAGASLNVFKEDFIRAWECVKEETEKILLPAKCAGCSKKDICKACAAMVYTESGCFDQVPQYRCSMVKAFISQRKRIEEMLKENSL